MQLIVKYLIAGLFLLPIFFVSYSKIVADNQKTVEAEFQLKRVSGPDPVMNLAGCMVNHATSLSKLRLSYAIFKTENALKMTPDELSSYDEIRDLLISECKSEHFPKLMRAGVRNLDLSVLNSALFAVLHDDPEVKNSLAEQYRTQQALKSIYVK